MTRRSYIVFVFFFTFGLVCAFVTPLTIAMTGRITWLQVGFLAINVVNVLVLRRSFRRMRQLRREQIARVEQLRQRLAHDRERGDYFGEQLTLALMTIWDVRGESPQVPPPWSSDDF